MKVLHYVSGICIVILTAGFFGEAAAFATDANDASSGIITGTVSIIKTKVKTDGPKSFKDVVVYLEKVGNNDFPAPTASATMDQRGLVFIPHVLAVQKGTTVEVLNNDHDKHNAYFVNDKTGETKDIGTWDPGESRSYVFDGSELVDKAKQTGELQVLIVLCKLHLEMAAYIVVLDNPFFATVSIDEKTQKAQYTIKNVPPGEYKLNTWHKELKLMGGAKEVVVKSGETSAVDMEITKAKYANTKS